ncbi:glycosyltransferase family 2 protein [Nitrospira moscoviensis]|uniref:Putative Glycosyl transferase n=1 Tax=Nitrospira moscoviensis TaxID=42253 RepID=A0A0K2GJN0_NITMO|nr:glycosyltransferase family 2 protein [Nitrospira moscoviensis]ALA61146.1 putative Glycosyl transferase [Nitrospira moscoviensis]
MISGNVHTPNPSLRHDAPMVSIIMTTYNAERFIKASVLAALAQDYPNFEVVVVDDGSTDRTAAICEEIHDPRLRVHRAERIGRSRALNKAVELARGEYIANNDADDLSFTYRLSYVMKFARLQADVAFIGTPAVPTQTFVDHIAAESVPPEESSEDTQGNVVWPSRITVFRRNLFNHSTLVYPKTVWRLMGGYDEGLDMCEDYDFYLRAMQFGRAAILPKPTVVWLTESGGYFRKKSMADYLKTMNLIKRRAYRLLNLPLWMRPYHALWTQVYKAGILYRGWPEPGT